MDISEKIDTETAVEAPIKVMSSAVHPTTKVDKKLTRLVNLKRAVCKVQVISADIIEMSDRTMRLLGDIQSLTDETVRLQHNMMVSQTICLRKSRRTIDPNARQ
ncbi:hypothetical protein AB6A40_009826 [Gnathostoma spinigerum]|uniref:Uncharacterized protein n=1 Tax=Gnathostoma spinigerum TaxID=75299 RepID=A0ABD6F1C5_9BILA